MDFHKRNQGEALKSVKFKRSILAMCVMALSAPSFAQTEAPSDVEEVIITGQRENLQNAQEIKRNASTVVDSISAEDIGSLPDRSVLEAMQRIPGVSIERFAAAKLRNHYQHTEAEHAAGGPARRQHILRQRQGSEGQARGGQTRHRDGAPVPQQKRRSEGEARRL